MVCLGQWIRTSASTATPLAIDLRSCRTFSPEITEFYQVMRMSVNWDYATEDTELSEGDEVAFIPPVTGGKDVQDY